MRKQQERAVRARKWTILGVAAVLVYAAGVGLCGLVLRGLAGRVEHRLAPRQCGATARLNFARSLGATGPLRATVVCARGRLASLVATGVRVASFSLDEIELEVAGVHAATRHAAASRATEKAPAAPAKDDDSWPPIRVQIGDARLTVADTASMRCTDGEVHCAPGERCATAWGRCAGAVGGLRAEVTEVTLQGGVLGAKALTVRRPPEADDRYAAGFRRRAAPDSARTQWKLAPWFSKIDSLRASAARWPMLAQRFAKRAQRAGFEALQVEGIEGQMGDLRFETGGGLYWALSPDAAAAGRRAALVFNHGERTIEAHDARFRLETFAGTFARVLGETDVALDGQIRWGRDAFQVRGSVALDDVALGQALGAGSPARGAGDPTQQPISLHVNGELSLGSEAVSWDGASTLKIFDWAVPMTVRAALRDAEPEGDAEPERDAELEGAAEPEGHAAAARFQADAVLGPTGCAPITELIPEALLGPAAPLRWQSAFQMTSHFAWHPKRPLDTEFDIRVVQGCDASAPEGPSTLFFEAYQQPFLHRPQLGADEPYEAWLGPGSGAYTAIGALSGPLIASVLAHEDAGFFRHRGFSFNAVEEAVRRNLSAESTKFGASTISMQLAKNLFLSFERRFERKFRELLLTVWLEQAWGKRAMLDTYLNIIEWGPGVFGVTQAAKHYFAKPASHLDWAESAVLALLLPAPRRLGDFAYDTPIPDTLRQKADAYMTLLVNRYIMPRAELGPARERLASMVLRPTITFSDPGPAPTPFYDDQALRCRLGAQTPALCDVLFGKATGGRRPGIIRRSQVGDEAQHVDGGERPEENDADAGGEQEVPAWANF